MKRILPTVVAVSVGLIVLLHQFIANQYLDPVGSTLIAWGALLAGVALLLGLFNVLVVHFQRLIRREAGAFYSFVLLLTALIVLGIGLASGPSSASLNWVFVNVYRPLEGAFLALVAFFIASAAYRALRARSWGTTVMLLTALIVLIGQVPLSVALAPAIGDLKDWILTVPTVAGIRGILLGVALGTLVTALRLLTTLDRPYSD
jgi:hypothetical protein